VTVRRLFVSELADGGGVVELAEGPSRHVRVLRLRVGDRVVLFDGRGRTAEASLRSVGETVTCSAEAPVAVEAPKTWVALLLAVPKGSKIDDCVRMATELGADEVMLMHTERTVPKWDDKRTQSRLERLTRIASEAASQCERSDVPIVHAPKACATWLSEMSPQVVGVVFAARAEESLDLDGTPEQVWCAVGPEGGFTEAELSAFAEAGFSIASLGTWVLRVETAVSAALALVQDRLDGPRNLVDTQGQAIPPCD
jgi:16S rRNA (uracil1498-N3)-methyltransferase